ncbi:MAG: winged helix-turn-helix transcriptional regulator [Saprospiraceae bacterium]|nr:Lrp/AsnC ligand binding domain-containing protein [Bacteroidia bacterium]NNE14668.1 winged helix-turn-helix transcriptional regulator [Saprospiraceae bacterium]NNL91541.1 winged helix-turn-helix transcriptional regulator [Saprospiraceae bacterium]
MEEILKFDPFDRRIIKELTADARIPFIQLAKKLKVSNTLVHQRIKKLKEAGIINNATFRLEPWILGYETSAYVQIMLTNAKLHREVENKLKDIPEIVECVNIAGRYALIVRIFAINNRHLRDIIYEKIQPIEGVEGTNTTMCFETAFVRNIPLPE